MLQVRGPSHALGLTVRRSLPALMSSLATPAPTQEKNASCAHFATSASCAATTWSSTLGAILTSSLPCWDATRAHRLLPALLCNIRMAWDGVFLYTGISRSTEDHGGFQVNQLQSDPLIRIDHCCYTQKCAPTQRTHTAGCEGKVASSPHPHRWVMWPLSTCSTLLGLGIENVSYL